MQITLPKSLFTSLLSFCFPLIFGTTPDISDSLTFYSEAEKLAFINYFDGKKDYFSLFYYTSPKVSEAGSDRFRQQFYQKVKAYKSDPVMEKKPAKLARTIYQDLHKSYLAKYEYSILFDQLFQKGSYNCLTASALYALCFQELGLEYDIRLMPQHVYLVLFPDQEAIKVETTNPVQGLEITNNLQKKQYVEFLRDLKLISEEEYLTNSVDYLFEKHYYSQETITIENLIGTQYYNSGLTFLAEEDYITAYNQFEKAYLWYPHERILYLAKASLGSVIFLEDLEPMEQARMIAKYPKYCTNDKEKDIPVELFKQITYEQLTKQGQPETYNQIYSYISTHVNDSITLNEISYIYNFEIGRYYLRTGQTEKSEQFFAEAFTSKPSNLDAQSALIEILEYQMRHKSYEDVFQSAKHLYDSYPLLQENLAFRTLCASIALSVASQAYSLENPMKGEEYLDKFEQLYIDKLEVNSYLVSDTYISAAVYYFGRGRTSLARKYINQGLNYSPDNYRLKSLQKSL